MRVYKCTKKRERCVYDVKLMPINYYKVAEKIAKATAAACEKLKAMKTRLKSLICMRHCRDCLGAMCEPVRKKDLLFYSRMYMDS